MRAIDADELRKVFKEEEYQLWHHLGIWAVIDNAPTIDPVKRAKWVQPDNSPMGCLVCSNCLTYPISKNGRWHLTKYCPDCGAKMEE